MNEWTTIINLFASVGYIYFSFCFFFWLFFFFCYSTHHLLWTVSFYFSRKQLSIFFFFLNLIFHCCKEVIKCALGILMRIILHCFSFIYCSMGNQINFHCLCVLEEEEDVLFTFIYRILLNCWCFHKKIHWFFHFENVDLDVV